MNFIPFDEPIQKGLYLSDNLNLSDFIYIVMDHFETEDTGEPFDVIIYNKYNHKIAQMTLTANMFYSNVLA